MPKSPSLHPVGVDILRASPGDHERLTEIAHAAKRYWKYPEHWIERWRPDLTLRPEFIEAHPVFAAWKGEKIAGFYALAVLDVDRPQVWSLEHLWVDPAFIGHGIGGTLYRHMMEEASSVSAQTVEIVSDPNATGFYEHMGAKYVRDHVGDPLDGRPRILPVYLADVAK